MTTTAVEVDYYAILGIERTASAEEIKDAVKKSMREWRKRTEAHDLGVRQEAELKVKWIEEARVILTDPGKRAAYDAILGSEGVRRTEVDRTTESDWLAQAEEYLARADYHSASYAAREATQARGSDARCWWVRSRANAGLNRWEDALYEAAQATTIEPGNAEYHFNLGCVAEEMRRWDQALGEFTEAARLAPTIPMYRLAVGGVYLQNNLPGRALEIIDEVYRSHPNDEMTQFYLGNALIDTAEHVPAKRDQESYAVTSLDEINRMRDLVSRAGHLPHAGDETRAAAAQIWEYLDRMETKTFRLPIGLVAAGGSMADAGCLGAILGVVVVGVVAFLPIFLFLGGFAAMSDGEPSGFLAVLASFPLAWLWLRMVYIPRWKANKKDLT